MRKHPDPGVRSAVTNGLHATERPDGIDTIIELMNDPDDNVRDWATFALGTQCDLDSPFVRDALRKQLNDSFENVRDEALSGLARRRDPETLRLLVQRLNATNGWMAIKGPRRRHWACAVTHRWMSYGELCKSSYVLSGSSAFFGSCNP